MGVATVSLRAVGKRLFGRSHRLHALVAKAREQCTPDSELPYDGLCSQPYRQFFEDCSARADQRGAGWLNRRHYRL
jgi:hypothetical protein